MAINRRKKNSRLRGSHTHGWGAKKKHRGSGHRGGRGRAGSGKRADSKKPSIWKDTHYFGKHGFKPKGPATVYAGINLKTVDACLHQFVSNGCAHLEQGVYTIDLGLAGYTKLISTGKVRYPLNISVEMASSQACEKVSLAGGNVHVHSSNAPSKENKETSRAPPAKGPHAGTSASP